jgi:hypothetical protein
MLDILPLAGFLLCCRLPLFSPQQGSWSSDSLMGAQVLSWSHSGEHWVSVHCGGRPPSTSRVVGYHSVEELEFQLLDRRDMALLQGGTV